MCYDHYLTHVGYTILSCSLYHDDGDDDGDTNDYDDDDVTSTILICIL